MSLKKVYEFLEKAEGGQDVMAMLKAELEDFREQDAKIRLAEKQIRKLTRESTELEDLKGKLESAQIDLENLEKYKESGNKEDQYTTKIKLLTTQISDLQKKFEDTEKAKQDLENKSKTDTLKSSFVADLSPSFGKMADVLIEREILKGNLKLDEEGKAIYQTEKGIYDKTAALELLKKNYKEHILPGKSGSDMDPPGNTDDADIDTNKNMSAHDLLLKGYKQRFK